MKKILIGIAIVLLAFFFRFNNLNWDDNFHLHPDERFLTMVGTAMKLPSSINQYFDQKTSLMNPANIGYKFFVYGRFPLILTKYLAVNLNLNNYNDLTILGRQLSAFFDLLIVLLVFKTVWLLEKHYKLSSSVKYWASFFYAIAVLPIQLSHFFAVDTFLNFFMFGSFYLSLKFYYKKKLGYLIFSAIFFGLAIASKVTAVFILPLNLFFILLTYLKRPSQISKYLLFILFYFGVSSLTLRLADPYLFQTNNFFNPTLNTQFMENIKQLKSFEGKDIWYPPAVQWINKKSIIFSLINLAVFGIGIPYFILIIIGIIRIISNQFKKFNFKNLKIELIIILIWVLGFFLYQSIQFVKAMRYFIFLYPFFAIFAALGMSYLIDYKFSLKGKLILYPKIFSYIFIFISVLILLLWPIMFSSIYSNKNSRVEASEWIYKNLPNGSYILSEAWDDSLPLPINNNYGKQFSGEQLPIFDPDTPEKWQKMNEMLQKADYYVLSSNRGWGSIPTVPQKYPLMSQFYNDLLSDKNSKYKKMKEFKPFYYRFFELSNNLVDESFTVYDHPEVLIFKNEKHSSKTF